MTVEKTADYGTPLHFLAFMLVFAYSGYHLEPLMGLRAVIFITIWAVITLLLVVNIKKQGLSYDHPKVFLISLLTLTIVGAFISSVLNTESFILLLFWYVVTLITLNWLAKNPKADKRLYYLISLQFIAFGIGMASFLHYSNLNLKTICTPFMMATHAEHHGDASNPEAMMKQHESAEKTEHTVAPASEAHHTASAHSESSYDPAKVMSAWLKAFQYLIVLISLWVSLRAFRLGRCQQQPEPDVTASVVTA
ncbi:hypothetical protein BegalDRAFT_3003 [Beggiatoa alba B18LD]|uniref:Uncharacterized protein n=1 Tax=Beggiatoa alba B18LD TaxID=395493 RepID=I3CJN7_9GAMM|nr:hypothetical protein [Beggiatoa alba]EIJ43830.1 hypothetical protein BegalDRAFT_3003 [Beggiatoa alba B18LD]